MNINYIREESLKEKIKNILEVSNEEKLKKILKYMNLFMDIGNKEFNLDRNYESNIFYRNQYLLFKNIFINLLNRLDKTTIVFNNFDFYDFWSKKIVEDILHYNFKNNLNIVITTTTGYDDNIIDKYFLLKPEKIDIKSVELTDSLKTFLLFGDSLSENLYNKIFEKLDSNKNSFDEFKNELLENDFIFNHQNIYYLLNKNLGEKLFKRINDNEKNEIARIYLKVLESLPSNGLYDYFIKIEILERLRLKEKEKKEIYKLIELFKKLEAHEDLINLNKRLLDLEVNKNTKEDIIDHILKYYKKSDHFKEGLEFIKNLDIETKSKKFKNTVNYYYYYYKRNLGETVDLLSNMLTLANEAKNNNWLNLYVEWMGEIIFITFLKGEYLKAKKYLNKIYNIKDKIDKKLLISNYYTMKAFISEKEMKYEETIENYKKAIEIAQNNETFDKQTILLTNLGETYYYYKYYDRALEVLNKARSKAQKFNLRRALAFVDINLCFVYLEKYNLDKVKELYSESLDISKKLQKERFILYNYFINAKRFYLLGDFQNAIIFFTTVKNMAKKLDNKRLLSYSYLYFGLIYYYRKQIDDSEKNLIKGIKIAQKRNNREYLNAVFEYSKILFDKSEYEKLSSFIDNAIELSQKLRLDELYLFNALKHYYFEENKKGKIRKIKNTLDKVSRKHIKADIYFLLWKVRKKDSFREKVFEFYKEYRDTNFLFDMRLKDMQKK